MCHVSNQALSENMHKSESGGNITNKIDVPKIFIPDDLDSAAFFFKAVLASLVLSFSTGRRQILPFHHLSVILIS
jgi:hypothetical protein